MVLARPVRGDSNADLELALVRMGLPTAGREYLLEKIPHTHLLLTGMGAEEVGFLRGLAERAKDPGREPFPAFVLGDRHLRPGSGLLSGRKAQHDELCHLVRGHPALRPLGEAVERALAFSSPPAPGVVGGKTFSWGARTYVMGIVNVTPDSFSDGGKYASTEAAVAHALQLVEAGADLLDVGGESSRPGAAAVSAPAELDRVLPVLKTLRARTDVPLSVDTRKASVARAALAEGASLVNDVSGLRDDPEMAGVLAQTGASCCLMHMQGSPATMQLAPRYDDLLGEVLDELHASILRATAAGVDRSKLWVDPGIGFGKTLGHNLFLLRRLEELRVLGVPVVVGTSRKAFLGALLGGRPPEERLAATLGSVASMAVLGGADVVRVHDVGQAKEAVAVADAIRTAQEGGDLFQRRGVRV